MPLSLYLPLCLLAGLGFSCAALSHRRIYRFLVTRCFWWASKRIFSRRVVCPSRYGDEVSTLILSSDEESMRRDLNHYLTYK
jgi:hypothetical protein